MADRAAKAKAGGAIHDRVPGMRVREAETDPSPARRPRPEAEPGGAHEHHREGHEDQPVGQAWGTSSIRDGLSRPCRAEHAHRPPPATRAHRPDVAIIDVTPAADTGFAIADALLTLPAPPILILTSSTGRTHFGAQLNGHRFIAKADICTAGITRLATAPKTHRPESPNRRVPRRGTQPRR